MTDRLRQLLKENRAADVRPDLDVFCIAATADTFGFHLELTEKWTEKKLGILHKPLWGMS